ncbi:MAG TPA: M20/M25/M40 family metallo-hydrolase [Gemmatimonadales bacterium]|nr:M20/M25/M40 family metallo-hydrolase [Gemmatimonadales bacterium]
MFKVLMQSLRLAIPLAIGLIATSPLAAQSPPVSRTDVARILSTLADDSMQGRLTGTPGADRAAAFVAAEMARIGLLALGDSGYFQRVALESVTLPPRAGATPGARPRTRLLLLNSLTDLDTVPPDARRHGQNVLGEIEGSDPILKHEVVLVDAHYDHLGIGTPVNGDSIYNGADDDASGVTTVLEIARAIAAGPRPKRTIIFAAMTGEEVGLLGTRWYIAHPAVPIASMAANLEIEMIGRPDSLAGGPGKAWLTGYERSTLGDELKSHGIPIVPDPRPDQHFFERSDNIAFARAGVPAHTLSSFGLHADYHRPSDDFAHVDLDHMTAVIGAAVAAVRLMADGPRPEWHAGGRPSE